MSDQIEKRLFERIDNSLRQGLDPTHAFGLARFETLIEQWPSGWGDFFQALIYGDFRAPKNDLIFANIGITIHHEVVKDTGIRVAPTVLKADVTVPEKSVAAVKDAARRLNLLVGVLSYNSYGAPIRWWSILTNPGDGSSFQPLGERDPELLLSLVEQLPTEVRLRVGAAMYWMRQPRSMLFEQDRADQFPAYAGYWTAFECLVDAVNILLPRNRKTGEEKQDLLERKLSSVSRLPTVAEYTAIYREVIDPGFRAKAEHAMKVCVSERADYFIKQCFECKSSELELYSIRNAIQHGTVDIDDPEMRIIVESRFLELWQLVFSMLSGVLLLYARMRAI